MTFVTYAQNFEDVTLWRALKEVKDGFYIDVGASDPDEFSVTRAFSERGWSGINIEPLPSRHAQLLARRPRDINLRLAVSDASGTLDFYTLDADGLSTTDPALAARHEAKGFKISRTAVTVDTLAAICARYQPETIHFLKLDCEGSERAALQGADFNRYRPWIVLAEATEPNSQVPNHALWEPVLREAGYDFAWFDGLNRFYVAREHFERLAPLLAQPPSVFDGFAYPDAAAMAASRDPVMPPSGDTLADTTPNSLELDDRIILATRCRDCDDVPKVASAGQVQEEPDGTRVQIMHNGLKVLADGYCGPWMTRLINLCRGHHEPQEERLFHEAVRALPANARMIELGGNWAYYTAWFLQGAAARRAVVLEPDPQNRACGEATMRLNGLQASFVAGVAGATGEVLHQTERSGDMLLQGYSVGALMHAHGFTRLDLLHCDTQGAELAVLEECRDLFRAGRIGLVFVSTHVHQISRDPLTHQRCLAVLRECGAVIEAEHDPYESFSGDGLIVARFGPAPPGWRPVPISLAKRSEALFRDPLFDLVAAHARPMAPAVAARIAAAVYDALLNRPIDPGASVHWSEHLIATGDVAPLLKGVLKSPEFRSQRLPFESAYFGPSGMPPIPEDSPLACKALNLVLTRDTPLGATGDTLVVPNDRVILPTVLASGAWATDHTAFVGAHIDPARRYTLLDIGANCGLFSRQVLRAFPCFDVLCCAEPDPGNFEALCRNLAGFSAVRTVKAQIGLGATTGTMTFFHDLENCGNNSLHADAMRKRPHATTTIPVQEAGSWLEANLPAEGPIVWKSDTQGNDEAILAATPWPIWSRVTIALVELWRIHKGGGTPDGFFERVGDMPNRTIAGQAVSVDEVAAYLAGDDWAHDDLLMWR